MIGYDFDGAGVTSPTPEGGTISFALGKIQREAGAEPEPAAAFHVLDANGEEVARFALTAGSFRVLLNAMRSTFRAANITPPLGLTI